MSPIPYFAYGTTQKGFAHHDRLRDLLGEPVARCRTVEPHAVVVPDAAACSNPGCPYVHRMATLVPGFAPTRATGDLFLIADDGLAVIDELELAGPYARATVAVEAVEEPIARPAQAYLAREPARWRALVEQGRGRALDAYPPALAEEVADKPCCARAPGHPPPHDVVDPLAGVGSRPSS